MKNFYEMNTEITATMSDTAFNVKLSAILELMQDAQTFHTKQMNADAQTLKKECGAFWVIRNTKIHFFKLPVWQQRVKVVTYPMKPTLLKGERQNYITDENGNILVAGKSDWCVLDCETRKPRTFPSVSVYPLIMEHKTDRILEGQCNLNKYSCQESDFRYTREIKYSDLDFNHHVNNVKYVDFLTDCFDSGFWEEKTITDFEISYDREIPEGSSIDIYATVRENEIFFCGKNNVADFFKAKIVYKAKQ